MGYKIKIDWKKDNLYGWEGVKPKQQIDVLRKAICRGYKLPVVHVYKIDSHNYQLIKDAPNQTLKTGKDGGHSRSFAHYKENEPLECIVEGTVQEIEEVKGPEFGYHMAINIKDIILKNNSYAQESFRNLQKKDENYR